MNHEVDENIEVDLIKEDAWLEPYFWNYEEDGMWIDRPMNISKEVVERFNKFLKEFDDNGKRIDNRN